MTRSGQNEVVNEFLMQKSVLKVVLHLHVHCTPRAKKVEIFIMADGGLFDLAITQLLAG